MGEEGEQFLEPIVVSEDQLVHFVCVEVRVSEILRLGFLHVGENVFLQKFLDCVSAAKADACFLVFRVCDPDNDLQKFIPHKILVSLVAWNVLIHISCDVNPVYCSQVAVFVISYLTLVTKRCEIVPTYYWVFRVQNTCQEHIFDLREIAPHQLPHSLVFVSVSLEYLFDFRVFEVKLEHFQQRLLIFKFELLKDRLGNVEFHLFADAHDLTEVEIFNLPLLMSEHHLIHVEVRLLELPDGVPVREAELPRAFYEIEGVFSGWQKAAETIGDVDL